MRALLLIASVGSLGCSGGGAQPGPVGADFSGFDQAVMTADGVELNVWLAKTPAQQQQGLMNATAAQLQPDGQGRPRGMLFVFPAEQVVSFFMRDTYVPLDLAYATADGTIVEIHALVPLDETPVPSGQPVQFALEVPAGTLATNGIAVGELLGIPPEAFN